MLKRALSRATPTGWRQQSTSAAPKPYQVDFVKPSSRPTVLPPSKHRLRIVSPSFDDPSTFRLLNPGRRGPKHVCTRSGVDCFTLRVLPTPTPIRIVDPVLDAFPAKERAEHISALQEQEREARRHGEWTMRLLMVLRVKELGKSAVARKRLFKRWKAAVRLIVLHGACSSDASTTLRLDEALAGPARWLLPRQYAFAQLAGRAESVDAADGERPPPTYVVSPTPYLGSLTMVELVDAVSTALLDVKAQAERVPLTRASRSRS